MMKRHYLLFSLILLTSGFTGGQVKAVERADEVGQQGKITKIVAAVAVAGAAGLCWYYGLVPSFPVCMADGCSDTEMTSISNDLAHFDSENVQFGTSRFCEEGLGAGIKRCTDYVKVYTLSPTAEETAKNFVVEPRQTCDYDISNQALYCSAHHNTNVAYAVESQPVLVQTTDQFQGLFNTLLPALTDSAQGNGTLVVKPVTLNTVDVSSSGYRFSASISDTNMTPIKNDPAHFESENARFGTSRFCEEGLGAVIKRCTDYVKVYTLSPTAEETAKNFVVEPRQTCDYDIKNQTLRCSAHDNMDVTYAAESQPSLISDTQETEVQNGVDVQDHAITDIPRTSPLAEYQNVSEFQEILNAQKVCADDNSKIFEAQHGDGIGYVCVRGDLQSFHLNKAD